MQRRIREFRDEALLGIDQDGVVRAERERLRLHLVERGARAGARGAVALAEIERERDRAMPRKHELFEQNGRIESAGIREDDGGH